MEQQETKIAKKDLIRKKTGYPGMEIHKSGEVEYLTFPALERLNIVTHMVTSRFGGVSTGDCASFNFSYARDTSREAVDENFRRAAGVFGTTSDAFVCSDQTHTTNIRRVEKEDARLMRTVCRFCLSIRCIMRSAVLIPGGGGQSVRWEKRQSKRCARRMEAVRRMFLRRLGRRSVRTAMKSEKMWQNLLKSSFLRRDIRTFP